MFDIQNKRCFVLDMDGTVYVGGNPIRGAVDFIKTYWNTFEFYFLTNNTSKSPQTYVHKLNGMGIPARLEQIISPVMPLVLYLRKQGIRRSYVVGNADFQADLHARMPELTQDDAHSAEAVILAYDTELTYAKLCASALLLQKPEVRFLATHPDLVCPSPQGPLPDVGSFLALYKTATGREPQQVFGKPDAAILAPLLERYSPAQMVMVGDRLSTDKRLGENADMDFILVLSGEATRADAARCERQPTLILEDLGCLPQVVSMPSASLASGPLSPEEAR